MTSLNETLESIAVQVHAPAQELIAYAAEDNLGGYHWNGALATFKQGSCFGVEGQTIYALIRWLKPDVVAEIGGWAGCSGSHIAAALIKNGKGKLYSVDNEIGGQAHGVDMQNPYRAVTELVRANGQDWLAQQPDGSIGLIFEDADHSTELVALLSRLALEKLVPGGLLLNHDAAHDFAYDGNGQASTHSTVGREVRDGLAQANAYFRVYRAEPSDCGLAVTVNPKSVKPYEDELKSLSPSEFKRLHQNEWSSPIASDHLAALSQPDKHLTILAGDPTGEGSIIGVLNDPTMTYEEAQKHYGQIGNANIESQSEPPAPTEKRTIDLYLEKISIPENEKPDEPPKEVKKRRPRTPKK